jgi:hypothetical protein
MGLAHPSIAPYGVFRSKDGRDILISIQSEREWKKLCADVLGQPELPDDVRFSNMVERVRNRKLTDQTVGDIFATMTRDELLQRLSDADIAFAEVNTMADLAVHPHLRRIEVDTPAGPVSYPAPAAIVVDQPRHYGAVPGIGERFDIEKPASARIKSSRPTRSISTFAAVDRPHRGGLTSSPRNWKGSGARCSWRSAGPRRAMPRPSPRIGAWQPVSPDVELDPTAIQTRRRLPAAGGSCRAGWAGGSWNF